MTDSFRFEKEKNRELTIEEDKLETATEKDTIEFFKARGVPVTNGKIDRIKKEKENIRKAQDLPQEEQTKRRRITTNKFTALEEDTLAFVKQCRDLNVSVIVSVASISTAALKLAKRHGISQDEFHASNGWVNNFVKKYKLRSKLLQGERASAPKEVADVYKATLPEILSLYQPENIYNADEVGLNWERTARRSYILEGDDTAGTKLSKKTHYSSHYCVNGRSLGTHGSNQWM